MQYHCGFCPGGHSTFFQEGVCGPYFLKCGACELIVASEKGGLWTENSQIWGLVNWKFSNLGACELKISKFGGLTAKIWVRIEAVEAKISKFSQKGACELTHLLGMGPLRTAGEAWKGGLQGCTSPYPLSRSVPPPPPPPGLLQVGVAVKVLCSYLQELTFISVCKNQILLKLQHLVYDSREIDPHIWMLQESLRESILWFSLKVRAWSYSNRSYCMM